MKKRKKQPIDYSDIPQGGLYTFLIPTNISWSYTLVTGLPELKPKNLTWGTWKQVEWFV